MSCTDKHVSSITHACLWKPHNIYIGYSYSVFLVVVIFYLSIFLFIFRLIRCMTSCCCYMMTRTYDTEVNNEGAPEGLEKSKTLVLKIYHICKLIILILIQKMTAADLYCKILKILAESNSHRHKMSVIRPNVNILPTSLLIYIQQHMKNELGVLGSQLDRFWGSPLQGG